MNLIEPEVISCSAVRGDIGSIRDTARSDYLLEWARPDLGQMGCVKLARCIKCQE